MTKNEKQALFQLKEDLYELAANFKSGVLADGFPEDYKIKCNAKAWAFSESAERLSRILAEVK